MVNILAAAMLICSATFAWAEGTTLIWENVSHQVSKGKSLASIAGKEKITPTALMAFNGLSGATLRPNMTLVLPKIKQVAALPGKTSRNHRNLNVKAYQIYSANAKCYTMVFVMDEDPETEIYRLYINDEDMIGLCVAHKDIIGIYNAFMYSPACDTKVRQASICSGYNPLLRQ